jgi:hypothetical protein
MKLFRASVGLFVAILCVGLALLSPSARAEEASKPTVPGANDDAGADHVPPIQIPPQAECLAKTGNWSEPEKWAWQQICAREPIDFNRRSGGERSEGQAFDT